MSSCSSQALLALSLKDPHHRRVLFVSPNCGSGKGRQINRPLRRMPGKRSLQLQSSFGFAVERCSSEAESLESERREGRTCRLEYTPVKLNVRTDLKAFDRQ